MRSPALTDDILLRVDKPARYIGGEFHSVMKDPGAVDIRFALCFPDVYEIGMSNLGVAILYDQFNQRKDTWCERVFCPWVDLADILRDRGIPLFALESQEPLTHFDFLAFSIGYEMCYTNILEVLDLAGIPLLADVRGEDDPIILGGGPCTCNPEPLADFFDCFYLGEGEVSYDAFFDLYKSCRRQKSSRLEFLERAALIPGIYVPSLYDVSYDKDGTIAAVTPVSEQVPDRVRRQVVSDPALIGYPAEPIVPFVKAVQDRVVVEVMRGCIRGCRFCQAGTTYRPCRARDPHELAQTALTTLQKTGYDELSLSSLSTSDYPYLSELLDELLPVLKGHHIELELPSLRIDAFSLELMDRIGDVKNGSFTFAPEAGTQRLRDVINKGLTEEEILDGARLAFEGGWRKVKLYYMLGLPTETDEDAQGIAELADRIARVFYAIPREERSGRCQITVSSSFFVPKPFTPFQWSPMLDRQTYVRRTQIVKDAVHDVLNSKSIRYQWHASDMSFMEAVLARGDRRLGGFLLRLHEKGARFDAWTEYFDEQRWFDTFEEAGIDPAFYALRERTEQEIFPWDHLDMGISRAYLLREYRRAANGEVTPNCRECCSGCGIRQAYGGGVCCES